MAATMAQCIRELAGSGSEKETRQILGAAFQILFLLGHQQSLFN
jgi:hypothetical protein